MSALLVRLEDAADARVYGGKTAALSRLSRERRPGAHVPRGVAIAAATLDDVLAAAGLAPKLAAVLADLDPGHPAERRAAAATIRELVLALPLPDRLLTEIARATGDLASHTQAHPRLIVRSSALGEDSAAASFAGQLDSRVVDPRPPDVERALREVWASAWGERALHYQHRTGVRLDGVGVLIQELVPASFAGVLFTVDPQPGADGGADLDTLRIEYTRGTSEDLVQGRVDPAVVRVARAALTISMHTHPATDVLTRTHILKLARFALALETRRRVPLDIEWLLGPDQRLVIVQVRPITALPRRDEVWSNVNLNENYPRPVSPFLHSVAARAYHHYFRGLATVLGISARRIHGMERSLDSIVGLHAARLYYNLTSVYDCLRLAPFGDHVGAMWNRFVGVYDAPAGTGQDHAHSFRLATLRDAVETLRMALSATLAFATLGRRIRRFEAAVAAQSAANAARARPSLDLVELGDELDGFLDIRFHRWTDAALGDAAAMFSYGFLGLLLRPRDGGDDDEALRHRLLKGIADVVSRAPAQRLWLLAHQAAADPGLRHLLLATPLADALHRIPGEHPAFARDLDRYLADYGCRFSGELMLTEPGPGEEPLQALALVAAYLRAGVPPPDETVARHGALRQAETDALLERLGGERLFRRLPWPRRRLPLRIVLGATQRSIVYRERARLAQARLYGSLRRTLLDAGLRLARRGDLGSRDDVFLLTFTELDETLRGTRLADRALIERRRDEHRLASALPAPPVLRWRNGRLADTLPAPAALVPDHEGSGLAEGSVLRGHPVSGGRAAGTARVLRGVAEAASLGRGEILVARETDPGWAAAFPLIAGLALERGGMLSHGAILAREFGIPAVTGIADATSLLPDGVAIVVDGDQGTVVRGHV